MGNQDVKVLGEDAAAEFLVRNGMRVLDRNWRARFGEIDIVAMDGDTLVFVEVKARTREGAIAPFEAVDHKKQSRLRRLAEAYMAYRRPQFSSCRFDVVSVIANVPEPKLRHIPDAF